MEEIYRSYKQTLEGKEWSDKYNSFCSFELPEYPADGAQPSQSSDY